MKQLINTVYQYTLKQISNWPPSFCYILGKVFGEKYKLIQFIPNI